jgi:hypothetical protein
VNGIHGMPINFNFKSNLFQLIFKSIVSINFFGEKHGKNQRDTHFSNISRFIHAESLVKRLTSSQDIADAIMKRQRMANENNLLHGKLMFL